MIAAYVLQHEGDVIFLWRYIALAAMILVSDSRMRLLIFDRVPCSVATVKRVSDDLVAAWMPHDVGEYPWFVNFRMAQSPTPDETMRLLRMCHAL